jgi:predicted GH43/DUF377 family glycosyl hydrolase
MKILKIKNIFPNSTIARYNLAAWHTSQESNIFLVGREVLRAGVEGEPDNGLLKLFEMDTKGKILRDRVIWEPAYEGMNLEDPRVLELSNENLVIGMTAVIRDKRGVPIPFPAIVKIDSHHTWNRELPPFLFIGTFGSGKNVTPIDNHTFIFRPDSPNYHHNLLVFSLFRQVPEKLCDIAFPTNLAWAQWKIGTTMPPIWITENDALFIFHGITKQKTKEGEQFIYSIGRAKLTKVDDKYTVTVSEDPILTPDDFLDAKGKPLVKELHPKLRRVVYSCGGLIKKGSPNILSVYVNVGDRTTFEVDFDLNEIKNGLFD